MEEIMPPDRRTVNATTVDVLSVARLVGLRMDIAHDPWRLSLVQRGLVWQERQVAYLLDSLLFGYPIGSFLLCTVRRGGSILEAEGGLRVRREAPEGTWQLLDGQQRLNSLAWLFAGPTAPEKRRFLVRLDANRDIDDVTLRKRKQEEALRYIKTATDEELLEERWRWLDVSGLHRAASSEEFPSLAELDGVSPERLLQIAESIDPACAAASWRAAGHDAEAAAADRVRRLLHAWNVAALPVVRLTLESPLDVLQVFARVNRTGTDVAGDDVFFAGVKTLWWDAEEHVERLRKSSPLLGRAAALRLLARVAAKSEGDTDLVPLDVERLHGDQGRRLVARMEELARPESRLILRVRDLSEAAIQHSGLGHALNVVHASLFDHVFGWAFARKQWPPRAEELAEVWAYLFGASAFRYRQIFAEPFDRLAFQSAEQAGGRDDRFPLQAIAAECREKWPGLRKSRQHVMALGSEAEQRRFVNDNWNLALHIVQKVPYVLPPGRKIDWEHLYPQALVAEMRWKGPDDSRKLQRYEGANDLWQAGNLFALDESLNRSAQDAWPHEKLRDYHAKGLWPPDLFLAATEQADLLAACALFKTGKVVEGMPQFRRYVRERELRIFSELRGRYPGAFELASAVGSTEGMSA